MRNVEPMTRRDRLCGKDFGEVHIKKGRKFNKTHRGGGSKGLFRDMNTGKSKLSTVYEV